MLCLGASYQVTEKGGEHHIAARDFYRRLFTALEPGEIVTAIRIPAPPAGHGYAYQKLKHKIGDYATAAAAVVLTVDGNGSVKLLHRPHQRGPDAALGRGRRENSRRHETRHRDGEEGGGRRRGDHLAGIRPARYAAVRTKMAGVMLARRARARQRTRPRLRR